MLALLRPAAPSLAPAARLPTPSYPRTPVAVALGAALIGYLPALREILATGKSDSKAITESAEAAPDATSSLEPEAVVTGSSSVWRASAMHEFLETVRFYVLAQAAASDTSAGTTSPADPLAVDGADAATGGPGALRAFVAAMLRSPRVLAPGTATECVLRCEALWFVECPPLWAALAGDAERRAVLHTVDMPCLVRCMGLHDSTRSHPTLNP